MSKLDESAVIRAFVEAVCPEGPDLYLASFNELHCLQDATALINDLRAQLASRPDGVWVPVSERLPEEGVDVLCYWGDHVPYEVGIFSLGGQFGTIWQSANGDMHEFDADPSHWMPLPPAPKEPK